MSKRKIVILLIALLIFGSLGAYFVVKQRGGADVAVETGTLSGTVTEVETGLPIAGAELWLSNPNVLGREKVVITTDESGEFVKEGLAPDLNYNIKIAKVPNITIQYNNQKVEIYSNKESIYEAKVNNSGSVTASVQNGKFYSNITVSGKLYTRDGEPIANREIQIGKKTVTKTRENGSFETQLKRGIYPIFIIGEDYRTDYGYEQPSLYIDGHADQKEIVLYGWRKNFPSPSPSRAPYDEFNSVFKFIDLNGNPLPKTKITCLGNDGQKNEYLTDENGIITVHKDEFVGCKNLSFNWNDKKILETDFIQLSSFKIDERNYTIPLPEGGLLGEEIKIKDLAGIYIDVNKIKIQAKNDRAPDELPVWLQDERAYGKILRTFFFIDLPAGSQKLTITCPDCSEESRQVNISPLKFNNEKTPFILKRKEECKTIIQINTEICYSPSLNLPENFEPNLIQAIEKIQKLIGTKEIPQKIYIKDKFLDANAWADFEVDSRGIVISRELLDRFPPYLSNPQVLYGLIVHEFGHLYDARLVSLSGAMVTPSEASVMVSRSPNFQQKSEAILPPVLYSVHSAWDMTRDHFLNYIRDRYIEKEALNLDNNFAGHPWDGPQELFATDFHNYFAYHDTLVNIINGFGQNTENYNLGVFDYKFIRYMVDFASDNDYDFPIANSKDNQDPFPCGNIFENGKVWTAEQILSGDFLKCEVEQKPAALKGTVKDAKGLPIPGAKIEFVEKTYPHGDKITAITALEGKEKGAYFIPNIPLKEGVMEETTPVKASYQYDPSCPEQTVNVTLKSGQTTIQDFQLNCQPKQIVLGKVTNQDNNNPLPGATITMDPNITQTTNALGQYIIPCTPDSPCPANSTNLHVSASANGFVSQDKNITYQGDPITANFSLTVQGREADLLSHTPPSSPQSSTQDLKIQAAITDNVGVTEAKTYYRAEGQSQWQSIALTKKNGSNYEALIPKTAFVKDKKIQYYLSAKDAANNVVLNPANTPNSYHSVGFSWPPPPDTTAPTISSVKSSNVSQTSAAIAWTTNESAASRVEYGKTNSYGSIKESTSLVTNHSISLTSLSADTTYHYRVISKDSAGNQAASSDYTFKTLASALRPMRRLHPARLRPAQRARQLRLLLRLPDTTAPTISNVKAVITNSSTVTVTWTTNEAAATIVQYGTDTNYSSTVSNYSLETSHKAVIGGIKFDTLYHYRVVSKDGAGNQAASGDYQFRITDTSPPIIGNIQVKYITQNSAAVYWKTGEKATGRVNYGLTANYGLTKEDPNLVTSRSIKIKGLQTNTTYHYQVVSKDSSGNQAITTDSIFKTQASVDTAPPVILNIQTKDCTGTGSSTKYECVKFQTDEPTKTSIQYGLTASYGTSVAGETDYQTGHTGVLLIKKDNYGKIHHYRIIAKDKAGSQTTSKDYQFTAP